MVRDERLAEPDADAVADAVRQDCGRAVADVELISKGINAIYRLTFADGGQAVLKAATFNSTAELRPEPLLLERVARATAVPVPSVLETVDDGGQLGTFYFLLDHVDGRQVRDLTDLPPADRERLVRETGRLLARLHEYPAFEASGPLRVASDDDGGLRLTTGGASDAPRESGQGTDGSRPETDGSWPGTDGSWSVPDGSWSETFASLADHPVGLFARVHGGDEYGDDYGGPGRFADLVPDVVSAFEDVTDAIPDPGTPTVLHRDFHLDNFVLAPESGANSLVKAVLDFGDPYVGDYRLDLAFAEDAMVNVQLPLSGEARRLRQLLRTSYARERGVDAAGIVDERYAYYLLVQRCRWLAVFDGWDAFDDPAAVADAYRSFVRERLAEIE